MITSHGYHHQQHNLDVKMDPDNLKMGMGGQPAVDPFHHGQASPPFSSGGDEDFDPINLPPSALNDDHNIPQQQPQPQHHSPTGYNNWMYQQQQHWAGQQQQHHYMNGYHHGYHQHHHQQQMDGYYYQQQQQQQQHMPQQSPYQGQQQQALPGGPSPVGSHNTPSPQAHSEDGDVDPHIRNNNVLKRPNEDQRSAAGGYHHHHMMAGGGQMNHHHPHHHHSMGIPAAKKPKVSKRKKKRDPNEPQKPVSAYALFFRDSQANIKAANPNAAFGDVSKIVASMWDGLDPDNKAAYKKRTENAKKEYLKKLAAYRASLVSKGSSGSIPDSNPYGAYPYHHGGVGAGYQTAGAENGSTNANGNGIMSKASPTGGGGGGAAGVHPLPHPLPHPAVQGYNGAAGAAQQQPQGGVGGYMGAGAGNGQPIPPRPPMQQPGGYGQPYMHHGQQNGIMGHQQQQHHNMGHLESTTNSPPPQQPQQPNSESSSSTSAHLDPQTGLLIEAPSDSNANRSRSGQICARPGCNNQILPRSDSTPGGWGSNSEFCSNECVVGQCREVYSNWSTTSSATNGPNQPPNSTAQQPQQPTPQQQ